MNTESQSEYILSNLHPHEIPFFNDAFQNLAITFKIPIEHQAPIIEILETIINELENIYLWIYDNQNAHNALQFLIDYSLVRNVTKRSYEEEQVLNGRKNSSYDPIGGRLQLAIHSEHNVEPAILKYHGAAVTGVEHIYQLLRKNDTILRGMLFKHSTIPNIKELKELIKEVKHNIDFSLPDFIIEHIEILLNYLKTHRLAIRKQYHLVFELLYISDLIKLIKIANNIYGEEYTIINLDTTEKFNPTMKLIPDGKIAFIKAFLKNKARSERYHSQLKDNL